MKLARATIYYYSHESDNPYQELENLLDSKDWVFYKLFNTQEVEIGEWYDEIDLNRSNCTQEEYEEYFKGRTQSLIKIVDDAVELLKVSHLTKMSLDDCVDISHEAFINLGELRLSSVELEWVKNRVFKIKEEE